MDKRKIVILDGYTISPDDREYHIYDALQEIGDVTIYDRTPAEQVKERIGDAEIVITNKAVISEAVMAACPAMHYIGVTATGVNIVDIPAATARGIVVTNCPAYSSQAIAQHVIALLLHSASRVWEYDAAVKAGKWASGSDFCFFEGVMEEVAGKTLGIIGFGRIGQAVARAAWGLGMRVIVHTPHPKDGVEVPVEYVMLDELLAQSDVISLNCVLNEQTERLMNAENIAKTKRGVRIINAARGTVIDSRAMADALASGQVGCYMADVIDTEPPAKDNPLLSAPNTVLTPHVGWAPRQTRERLAGIVIDNLRAYLAGAPVNVVSGK